LLVACDKTDENVTEPKDESTEAPTEESTEEPTEAPTKPAETMDESRFNFLFKKELTCAFVLPDNSTDDENAVAEELAALIFGKLKKEPAFVKESDLTDALPYAIFIGNTSSQIAKDAIAALGERESAVVSDGNKLFLVFESLSSGKGAAEALVEEIDTDKAIKNAWLPLDFSLKYKALPEIDLLPAYEEDATVIDSGLNTELLIANWVSANAFEDYALKSVIISEGVEVIDWFAFYRCSSLESVTIPSSVRRIGHSAFEGCSTRFTVYCHDGSFAQSFAQSYGITYAII
jgi:hypothetical protein